MNDASLLQLLRLTSPALPIGAFAWSQGLEGAIEHAWVEDEASLQSWLIGLADNMLVHTDLPIMLRVYDFAEGLQLNDIQIWNDTLLAMRESQELWQEDMQLGAALNRLLRNESIDVWFMQLEQPAYAVMFALIAKHYGIERDAMLSGFLWAWAENLTSAAIKTIPLGQSAGQRVLNAFIAHASAYVAKAKSLKDDEIGAVMPGLAMVSAWHESQYSRLFRS